eukprot:CAMPEP_0183357102 /NCGR_PEP_ID=MMETSP0164_2-20130417/45380_1 /TAXON_ID=221442 /ORGANISM="Coccolithus pelagicus ssp braarudi, Strain PLY182g" /LENGTH=102 /DNA_ID=CAMNT_0025530657 /DNA_START=462 /DNA_END=767 /DNA_ORIENTATION=-
MPRPCNLPAVQATLPQPPLQAGAPPLKAPPLKAPPLKQVCGRRHAPHQRRATPRGLARMARPPHHSTGPSHTSSGRVGIAAARAVCLLRRAVPRTRVSRAGG